nr:TetR/AcrR family transcriptional regulator [Azospirillum melinis]
MILSQGYSGMTMEAVAQQAGVAKKTVYRFAANREELVGLIVGNWTDSLPPAFEAEAADPAEAACLLETILVLIAERVLTAEAVGLFRVLVNDLPARNEVLAIYGRNGIERSRRMLADWLARHRSRGVLTLADPVLAADLILSMVVAEPLRQIAIGIAEPQPAWDIRPRVRAALDLLKL